MGAPGAGKSTLARELQGKGYERLNRDEAGGSLAGLVPRLDEILGSGRREVVLDNTYPTRASRNEVIEAAWQCGVPVRCVWMTTTIPEAQINGIRRMIEVHGSLPTPEEIRERSKKDARYLLPDAQFRYERTLEPPTIDEGFVAVEDRAFTRQSEDVDRRALILDLDDVLRDAASHAVLARHQKDGWLLFVHAWRPQIARGQITLAEVETQLANLRQTLGGDVGIAVCPHDAGPPVCWCRKPIPGSVIEFAMRREVALDKSIVVGSSAADRTMAERIGARFQDSAAFLGGPRSIM
jgi:histidinol phosphatase-like enzyme